GNKDQGFRRSRKNLGPIRFDITRGTDSHRAVMIRIQDLVAPLPKFQLSPDARPYLAPTPNTPQNKHWELTEENMFQNLERVWRKEAKKTGKDGNPAGAATQLEFYIYGRDTPAADAPDPSDQRRRVTAKNVMEADARMTKAVEQGVIRKPGPVGRALLQQHLAGMPIMPEPADITVPITNTFRQGEYLDNQRLAYDTMSEEQKRLTEAVTRPMRCVIHMNLHDLRGILNLPFFDMSALHIFAAPTAPIAAPSGNMEDVDHDPENE
ncbi:hypothetical protein BGZ82_004758, partial [Podila clonocystis]